MFRTFETSNRNKTFTNMKFTVISNILSITIVAYWLIKDYAWFISAEKKVKAFFIRCGDLFCNFSQRINEDIELY